MENDETVGTTPEQPEAPRTPRENKHVEGHHIIALFRYLMAGHLPGTAIEPGTLPGSAMAEGSVSAAVIEDKSVTCDKLGDDVWAEVDRIMDEGFGEIADGSY